MLVTDLDGTLLNSQREVSRTNREALQRLGKEGIKRVVATGRSLYSSQLVLEPDFPIDFLIFSSGTGVFDWTRKNLLHSTRFQPDDVRFIARLLKSKKLPFMILDPSPANHKMLYINDVSVPDYCRRLERYKDFARLWDGSLESLGDASQFIVIQDQVPGDVIYQQLSSLLPSHKVVRATSPLDHVSTWIEVFPSEVSKAQAAIWLQHYLGESQCAVAAVGNDFNDLDLLHWADQSYVVANAPKELSEVFCVVSSNDDNGVAEVVQKIIDT